MGVGGRGGAERGAVGERRARGGVLPGEVYQGRGAQWVTGREARRDQPEARAAEGGAGGGEASRAEDPRHYRTMDEVVTDLKAQTPERLMKFWQDFAGASHGQFSVVGNVDPEALKTELQKLLGDWKSPQAYARIRMDYHGLPAATEMVEVPDKANAVLLQARNIPVSEEHPDYTALSMAVRLLGGSADARLFHRLREKESISYGAYASLSASRDVDNAMIDIRAILAPANIDRLQKALQEEIERVHTDGFTQTELDEARNALMDQRRQYLASEANVTSLLSSNLFWNTDMGRWTRRDEQIRALTLEQVNAAFRKWIDPKKALTVGAGSFSAARAKATEKAQK